MTDYSGLDWRWALKLANRGYDAPKITRAIAAKPTGRREPGSLKYMSLLDRRGKDAADRYARTTAERAVRWVEDHPAIRGPHEATLRLLEIEAAANALPWVVYGGPAARRALEGALVVGDRTGRVAFGLAWREWGELVGQDFEVIRKSGKALVDLGWMVRNPEDRLGRTSRYSLRVAPHIHYTPGDGNVGLSADRAWLNHDALRPDGLGDSSWYLLSNLAAPALRSDLARRTGLDLETLTGYLLRLERFGLVVLDDLHIRRVSEDLVTVLDAAAVDLGTADRLSLDKAKHDADRDRYVARRDVNVGVSA